MKRNYAAMKALKPILGILFLIFILSSCTHSRPEFSKVVTHFDDSTKGTSTLYFYPAVLDILNLAKDSNLTAVTKDIQKIKIVRLSKDTIDRSVADSLIDGVKSEKFTNLIEMGRNGYQIHLFVKSSDRKPNHYVAVAYSPKNIMVVDLLGSIPLKYVPELLSNKMSFSGFETVLNTKEKPRKNKRKSENGEHSRNK